MARGPATASRAAGLSAPGLLLGITLAASLLLLPGCGGDPAVAPLVRSGVAVVELGLVSGELAMSGGSSSASCPVPEAGFPEDVRVRVTVESEVASPTERSVVVPARTPTAGVSVDGLTPGAGYTFEVIVARERDGEVLFIGMVGEQTIRSGGRDLIVVPLRPVGRRGVLGVGAPRAGGDGTVTVPILVSNALALRGVQFDLCFDDTALELLGVTGVGRVAGFDGVAGAQPAPGSPHRVVLWSTDETARVVPGADAVAELQLRFSDPTPPGTRIPLVFTGAILAESGDANDNFETFFFDGSVVR